MICEECKKAGEKSRVTCHGGAVTLMYCAPYYEDGIYHHHDSNIITSSYECSNGHRWTTRGHRKCPSCNWPNDTEEKTA